MIVGLTWLTMQKHQQNLLKYQPCAIMVMSKLPLDFNSLPGHQNQAPQTTLADKTHSIFER